MKDIFNSYSGKELRRFVIEHNKKVKDKVKAEVKEIKNKILKKRLIDIKGLKKDAIVDKMLEQKQFFKDIKMRPIKSDEDNKENLNKLKKVYEEVVDDYIKNQDENKLNKDLKDLKKESDKNDLDILKGQNINKLKKQIIIKFDKDLQKSKDGKPIAPPRTKKGIKKNDPIFDLRKAIEAPPPKKDEGTHEMPDGTVMTGETHNKDSVKVPNIKISDFDEEQFKKQKVKLIVHLDNKNVKEELRRDIALQNINIDRKDKENNPKKFNTLYKWVLDKIKNATTKIQLVDIKKFISKKTKLFAAGDTDSFKLNKLDL